MIFFFINMIFMLLMILISVAFLTLLERKILGYIQLRKGPNKMLFKGMFQPFSDALKLLSKEWMFLDFNMIMFLLSPMFMFILSMMLWFIYPWINNYSIFYSMILMIFIMSLSIFPIFLIGWSSNSNYAMFGSLRSLSQMISFEISMFLMLFLMMLLIENYSFLNFIIYQMKIKFCMLLYPIYLMFILSMLIELNRTPFDLIEGESELVSGFNVEYYSGMFTMIFLSEYSNILFLSLILNMIFYGFTYWSLNFILLFIFHLMIIILIRGILPRIRYDKLMIMCWIDLLMITLLYLFNIYLIKEIFLNLS